MIRRLFMATLCACAIGCFALQFFALPAAGADSGSVGKPGRDAVRQAKADEFARMMQATNTVVLDVRTPREFKAGHIKGSVNISVGAQDFDALVKALDKSKTYLVLCASGVRSQRACLKMVGMGFSKVTNLSGGIMAWQSAGKPIEN